MAGEPPAAAAFLGASHQMSPSRRLSRISHPRASAHREKGTQSHRFSFIIDVSRNRNVFLLCLYTYRFYQIWATILASRRAIIYCLCAKWIGHIGCIQRAWPEGVWKEKMLHLKLDKWPFGWEGKSYLFPLPYSAYFPWRKFMRPISIDQITKIPKLDKHSFAIEIFQSDYEQIAL